MGLGGCDWCRADVVLRAMDIKLDSHLHRRLRVVFDQILKVEGDRMERDRKQLELDRARNRKSR